MAQQPVPPPIRVPLVAGVERRSPTEDKDELAVNVFYDINKNVDKTMYGLHEVLNTYYATKRPGIEVLQSGSGLGNGIFAYGTNLFIFQSYSPSTLGGGPPDGGTWIDFAWSSTLSLWVGVSETHIYTSPDLSVWTLRSYPGATPDTFRGVIWADNRFVLTGLTNLVPAPIYTSTNGVTWTLTSYTSSSGTPSSLTKPFWTGSRYIIGGIGVLIMVSPFVEKGVITSPDAVTWTESVTSNSTTSNGYAAGASNGGTVVGTAASGWSFTSTDNGLTWSANHNMGVGNMGVNTVYLGPPAKFVTFPSINSGSVATTPDGVTWTVYTNALPLAGRARGAASNGTDVVCITQTSGIPSAPWVSSDGSTFTKLDPSVSDEWTAVAVDENGNYIIGGSSYIVRLTKTGPQVIPY